MQPLATEDTHRPDSEASLQTRLCWNHPQQLLFLAPLVSRKSPASWGLCRCFPGIPGLGQGRQQVEGGHCLHQAGQAAATRGEGMPGQNSDKKEQTQNWKGSYLKLLQLKNFASCSGKSENYYQVYKSWMSYSIFRVVDYLSLAPCSTQCWTNFSFCPVCLLPCFYVSFLDCPRWLSLLRSICTLHH